MIQIIKIDEIFSTHKKIENRFISLKDKLYGKLKKSAICGSTRDC